jgi:hypothetical protein
MFGLRAPARTANPSPARASGVREAAATLPDLIRSSIAAGVRIARSNGWPFSMCCRSVEARSNVTASFRCFAFSNRGARSSITAWKPFEDRTVSCVEAAAAGCSARATPDVAIACPVVKVNSTTVAAMNGRMEPSLSVV